MLSENRTETYWSRYPDSYDKKMEYVVGNELRRDIIQELNRLPQLGKLVELGCGTGIFTEALVAKADSLLVTDLSDRLLEVAKKRIGDHPKVTLQIENCMATSFGPETIDSVFMANLIHVVESPDTLLQECHRILRKNGIIVIVTFTDYGMMLSEKITMGVRFLTAWGRPPAHTHSFSPDSLARMMEDNGFTILTSKVIGMRTKALFVIGKKDGGGVRKTFNRIRTSETSPQCSVSYRKGSTMGELTKNDALASSEGTAKYRFGYTDVEIERLRYQHHVWSRENQRFIARAGFSTGETVVDLGCGPGYTTLDLAQIVGSGGKVIAVDRDGERSLPLLKAQAEASGLFNIETIAADLESFDLQGESVDGVYGRWVLMYIPEATVKSLIRRIVKWLRPGGVCALTEFCNFRHICIHPKSRYLPEIAEALLLAVTGENGCNPEIGNDLPGILHSCGLDVEMNVIAKAVRATTKEWFWPDTLFRTHLPALVKDGFLAQRVLDDFLEEWEVCSKEPDAIFFGSPMMEVIGRRL